MICGHTHWSTITAKKEEKICHGGAEDAVKYEIKKEGRLNGRRNNVMITQAGYGRSGEV